MHDWDAAKRPITAFTLKRARTHHEYEEVGSLYREYARWLAIDANFPNLDAEIANLPGPYAPPFGELILAVDTSSQVLGSVSVRPLEPPTSCEMKRLYVRPQSRAKGVGRALADAAVRFARAAGYELVFLDTLPSMERAIVIYRTLGFEETSSYYPSPGPGALYFKNTLKHKTS